MVKVIGVPVYSSIKVGVMVKITRRSSVIWSLCMLLTL